MYHGKFIKSKTDKSRLLCTADSYESQNVGHLSRFPPNLGNDSLGNFTLLVIECAAVADGRVRGGLVDEDSPVNSSEVSKNF